MQSELGEFESRDAQVVAIGQGSGEQARYYCDQAEASFTCLGDPERASYRSVGFERGSWWSVAVRDLVTNPRESITLLAAADFKAAALPASDPLQLGGLTIVDREGVLRYRHPASKPDDMPENGEILRALDALRSG